MRKPRPLAVNNVALLDPLRSVQFSSVQVRCIQSSVQVFPLYRRNLWEAGSFLRTPFTDGCDGANSNLAPSPLKYVVLLDPLHSVQFRPLFSCEGCFSDVSAINWDAGLFLRTPFTEGCAGANGKTLPPGRQQRCTVRPITFSSVQFFRCLYFCVIRTSLQSGTRSRRRNGSMCPWQTCWAQCAGAVLGTGYG